MECTSGTTIQNSRVYFQNLDILRFTAALMVLVVHAWECWCGWYGYPLSMTTGDYKTLSTTGYYMDVLIRNMGVGVQLFFMISGFLITYLLIAEKEKTGKIHVGRFYTRRALRIWPLYFFLIALAPLIVGWLHEPAPAYLANIFFLNNYQAISTQIWEFPFAHFWSVCVEEHFYLVWPLLVLLVPVRSLPALFLCCILFSIGFRIYCMSYLGNWWHHHYLNTLGRMDELVVGAAAGWYYFHKPFSFTLGRPVRILILGFLVLLLCIDHVSVSNSLWEGAFKKYIYMAIFGFLMLHFLFNQKPLLTFRQRSLFHYLGKISFGIYMYGNILLQVIVQRIMQTNDIRNMYFFFALVIVGTILVAAISYQLLEKPFLRLKEKYVAPARAEVLQK
jgi:peptidoglycan/LPS O-acetylase OafA/YrhL